MNCFEHETDWDEGTERYCVPHPSLDDALKLLAQIKESDLRLAALRMRCGRRLEVLAHENPDVLSVDENLTYQQRPGLLRLAATLDHYYPASLGDD